MTPPLAIADTDAAHAMFAWLATERVEVAEAVYLDPKWRYCGRSRFTGTIASVSVSIRDLVGDALAADARRILLAHNHPSGDAEPSADDLAFTRRLALVLAELEMPLVDHLIVGNTATVSMRARGLL